MPATPERSATPDIGRQQRLSLRQRLKQGVLLFDGAMGTSIQQYRLSAEDFHGKEGCNEYLCLIQPDLIRKIHESFLHAGCDCVETNTFGANRLKLQEYGLEASVVAINQAAVHLARQAIERQESDNRPCYITGSLGPTGFLPSSSDPLLSKVSVDFLQEVYFEQALVLVESGVDALLIETGQDILEMKHAVIGARRAIAEARKDILLMVQPTLDRSGRMLLGTDLAAALPLFADLGVDTFGINCSTGPDEMRESVRYLALHSPLPISVMPNAGFPENNDGNAHYSLQPEVFAEALAGFVREFGVQIVGGCCGTTPKHIMELFRVAQGIPAPKYQPIHSIRAVSSSIKAVNLDEPDNKPVLVGERLNSQGSRRFKRLLLEEDYDGIEQMARAQVDEGAQILDVCVAMNERDDEMKQMCRLVRDLSQVVEAPLMIDSTEYEVIEAALKLVPGRAVVNSIHLEGQGERLHRIAPMLKKYGGAAVAMLIDSDGMAKTVPHKMQVARTIYDLVTKNYGLPPHALIFDPLTFTLATGEEEFKNAALETLETIRRIKSDLPGSYTILGISNASFGLTPEGRRVLNSVYLYHATKAGLDLVIVNAKEIVPYTMLSDKERELADALVLNKREDALADFIHYFETHSHSSRRNTPSDKADNEDATLPIEEQIRYRILNRRKDGIEEVLKQSLQTYTPAQVINRILLPAMKEVGDKMASGELILPFVLQSAEVMKRSVAYLEQFLPQGEQISRGTVVLGTVYGDVHDIGKNLVKTILVNNGYTVYDLGKQVPLPDVLAKAKEVNADAICLSALLVTTSKQMAYCVEECSKQDLHYPIIIGGAAINRNYGFRISCLDEELIYPGGVFYAKDAFEGLDIMNRLMNPQERALLMEEYYADIAERRNRAAAYEDKSVSASPELALKSRVKPVKHPPEPPFWGMRMIESGAIDLDQIYPLMDFPSLFRLSWGLKNRNKEEYERLLQEEFYPLLVDLLEECKQKKIFEPSALYGYFPCYAEGDDLVILENDMTSERHRFQFPRQRNREQLCLADYFASQESGQIDVLPMQLVTMGHQVSKVCNALDRSHEYSRGYYIHGLAVQMADALAEWLHRRVQNELGIPQEQGKRYSFGYPACPDLSQQVKQFELMEVSRYMNVTLTEAFQMEPEQSTSALVVHHPEAKYFTV